MKRLGFAVALLAALAGCGGQDPGQPAPGSISAGGKPDDGPKFAPKKGEAPRRAK